jgi:hypothetical protein
MTAEVAAGSFSWVPRPLEALFDTAGLRSGIVWGGEVCFFSAYSSNAALAAPFAQGKEPPHMTSHTLVLDDPLVLASSRKAGPVLSSFASPERTPSRGNRSTDSL